MNQNFCLLSTSLQVLKSDIKIFRSADPGLVHIFHLVECDVKLESSQYQMCEGTLYNTYASTSTLSHKHRGK